MNKQNGFLLLRNKQFKAGFPSVSMNKQDKATADFATILLLLKSEQFKAGFPSVSMNKQEQETA